MEKGQVRDETGRCVDTETAFRVGACIFYYRELENEKTIPFREQVLYQDEHIRDGIYLPAGTWIEL